jgi:hypothetical protein
MSRDFRADEKRDIASQNLDGENATETRILLSQHDNRPLDELQETTDDRYRGNNGRRRLGSPSSTDHQKQRNQNGKQ